jgi:hypothetical protein
MIPIQNTVASRYPPAATWGLIVVNCIVFLFQLGLSKTNSSVSCRTLP